MAVQVFTSYLEHAFASDEALVEKACRLIPDSIEYDTMIGRGLSGALIIPRLATLLGKAYAIVRKDSDSSHSGNEIEGSIGERWVFVDEFVATGATRLATVNAVQNYVDTWNQRASYSEKPRIETTYIGSYLYRDCEFESATSSDVISWGAPA